MTTTIRSSADGSKSYIVVGGTDRVTIDAATGKLTSTYSPPTGERSLALATMQKFADEFGSYLVSNGYQKLPSGLIIQWGVYSPLAANSSVNLSYPIEFPNAAFFPTAGFNSQITTTYSGAILTYNLSKSQIRITNTTSIAQSVFWFAIGY